MEANPQAYFSYTPSEVMAAAAAVATPAYVDTLCKALGVLAGKSVLDVGCGTGLLAEVSLRAGATDVTGIDISSQMIHYAQKRANYLRTPIRYLQQDACHLEFRDGAFDVVGCHLLLHTLPDPTAALREMYRVVSPGGRIVAIEPVEGVMLFSSADTVFCQEAAVFVNTYQRLAALASMDFDLGLRLPSLLAQTGWYPIAVEGFLHAFWIPPDQRLRVQKDASEQMLAWKRKLQQVARLGNQPPSVTNLPIFNLTFPDDLLTTFALIICIGEK